MTKYDIFEKDEMTLEVLWRQQMVYFVSHKTSNDINRTDSRTAVNWRNFFLSVEMVDDRSRPNCQSIVRLDTLTVQMDKK